MLGVLASNACEWRGCEIGDVHSGVWHFDMIVSLVEEFLGYVLGMGEESTIGGSEAFEVGNFGGCNYAYTYESMFNVEEVSIVFDG